MSESDPYADPVAAMKSWAEAHPEADTQGLMDDEWEALALAALDTLSAPPRPQPTDARISSLKEELAVVRAGHKQCERNLDAQLDEANRQLFEALKERDEAREGEAAERATVESLLLTRKRLERERDEARAALRKGFALVRAMDEKMPDQATSDEDGWITSYRIPTGPWHRLLGWATSNAALEQRDK